MNTKFTIKNFRVFDENGVSIDVKPMTILTGCNSSGKSSIVRAAFLLNSFIKQVNKIDFDIDSVNTLTALHEKFVEEEKRALDELSRKRKEQTDQFRYDFSNALNEKGFWCSQKAFRWIAGITLLSSIIIIVEITRYILF